MVSEEIRKQNKELCEKYPFLIPSNHCSNEKIPEFDYSYTELDNMPKGWRKAFGLKLCEELKKELKKHNMLETYRIIQIKEKYGSLRWYDTGNTDKGYKIIYKYSNLSAKTCIHCGEKATKITTDWISPYCDYCIPKDSPYITMEEYEKEREED